MSKALMCDRCRKTFDPSSQDKNAAMVRFKNPIIYTSECMDERGERTRIDGTVFKHMVRDDYADLCPHCTSRFLDFMWFAENTPPNTEKDGV